MSGRTRRRVLAAVLVAVAVLGAGAVVWASQVRAGEPAAEVAPLPTVAVTRGDLVTTVQQTGQLGYAGAHQLVGHRAGIITALPRVGQIIDRGQPVHAVDQRPVPLFFGAVPLYRPLAAGAVGEDVRLLEQNLVELGHATAAALTVDATYTTATSAAVRRWQRALGLPQTGAVEPGDAVVAPGPVRITSVQPLVGAATGPGETIAAGTGTGHGVHVDLDRRYRSLVVVDGRVRVQLFGGKAVDGTITTVGTAAAAAQDNDSGDGQGGAGQGGAGQQTVPVDIVITGPEAEFGGVFEGPVTVVLAGEARRGVLSVPVEALTVGPDGGYAVVVVDGVGRRTVGVTTGLITSSRAEISGQGIAEGTRVEVPSL